MIAARIIETALQGLSFEALYELNKCLSRDRVLEKVHAFSEESIQQIINKSTKMIELPKRIIAAIDFTEQEYYGDKTISKLCAEIS